MKQVVVMKVIGGAAGRSVNVGATAGGWGDIRMMMILIRREMMREMM
jgi:hypothetical protein